MPPRVAPRHVRAVLPYAAPHRKYGGFKKGKRVNDQAGVNWRTRAANRFTGESDNVKAVILTLMAGLSLTLIGAVGKKLGQTLHPFEISFVRSLLILVLMAPWFFRGGGLIGGLRSLKTSRPILMGLTGISFAAAIFLWFWALPGVPLDLVIALGFTTQLFSMFGAVLFLGEPSRLWRWGAMAVGLAGGLIIIRPGYAPISMGVIALLGCYLLFAANRLLIKVLTRTDRPNSIVIWFAIVSAIFSFPFALSVWQTPTLEQAIWLVVLSCLTTINHLTMTWAVRFGDIAVIEPVNLTRLLWAALIGFVVFGDIPEVFTLIGGAVLAGTVIYITRRERRDARERVVAPETGT